MCRNTVITPVKHRGLALLIFTVVLAFASISYTLGNISIEQLRSEQTATTQSVLQRAKQALLDYAVTNKDGSPGEYGFLPCPDYRDDAIDEGGSDGNCGGAKENSLGLFPWATLETGILRSGTGECLWYGVSGEYKRSPKTTMLNQDTNGAIRLFDANGVIKQGGLPQDRIVAVIIDPSKVTPGQNRVFDDTSFCGKDHTPARYLEGSGTINNAFLSGGELTIDDFIDKGTATAFNDQIVFITREELWDAVRSRKEVFGDEDDDDDYALNRLTEAMALCIAAYGNNNVGRKLPRPAAVNFGGGDYRIEANYTDTDVNSYLGRFPSRVNDSDLKIGHSTAPKPGQPKLFEKDDICDALILDSGLSVNLKSDEEYKAIWKNWKDHFFYAVSSVYAPESTANTEAFACDWTDCIVVDGVDYAAVVLFAGKREGDQVRNEPLVGDVDTKNTLANYIEVNDPVGDDTGDYTPTDNDIAFCIADKDADGDFDVVSCD